MTRDKSPKGSVDVHIVNLVDLINHHQSFATLSSCSGRISIFDPNLLSNESQNDENDQQDRTVSTLSAANTSGKGGTGGWLLVSHDPVKEDTVLQTLHLHCQQQQKRRHNQQPLIFKLEPLLLHVAAGSLSRGEQLLQLALQLGFRESGLVVTKTRVTVAIRSQRLALTVPLFLETKEDTISPPDSYITSLVRESNQRLQRNLERIDELYRAVETTLFRPHSLEQPGFTSGVDLTYQIHFSSLPDLNLWNHTMVTVPGEVDGADTDASSTLLVFGGYGRGPKGASSSTQRSSRIYSLTSNKGTWDDQWNEIIPSEHWDSPGKETGNDFYIDTVFGTRVRGASLEAREGAAACLLGSKSIEDSYSSLVVLFGGRKSPAHPLGDLLLCEYTPTRLVIGEPVSIQGETPSPRWGHTLTSLNAGKTKEGACAVLFGGRTETTTLNTCHILSIHHGQEECHFLWETLILSVSPSPRFHHGAVCVENHLIVFGGLSECSNPLEAFTDRNDESSTLNDVLAISLRDKTCINIIFSDQQHLGRFGHQICGPFVTAQPNTKDNDSQLLLLLGGLDYSSDQEQLDEDSPIVDLQALEWDETGWKLKSLPLTIDSSGMESSHIGPLVHHATASLTGSGLNSFASTGGGVMGFGFGPCYAKSFLISIQTNGLSHKEVSAETSDMFQRPAAPKSYDTNRGSPFSGSVPDTTNTVDVLYVDKRDAKSLKTQLEALSLLDKRRKMAPSTTHDHWIAVPVFEQLWQDYPSLGNDTTSDCDPPWTSLVKGRGRQHLPPSTTVYARHTKSKRPANP